MKTSIALLALLVCSCAAAPVPVATGPTIPLTKEQQAENEIKLQKYLDGIDERDQQSWRDRRDSRYQVDSLINQNRLLRELSR